MPSVSMLSDIMSCTVMLSDIILSGIMLSDIMFCTVMLSDIILSGIMLSGALCLFLIC